MRLKRASIRLLSLGATKTSYKALLRHCPISSIASWLLRSRISSRLCSRQSSILNLIKSRYYLAKLTSAQELRPSTTNKSYALQAWPTSNTIMSSYCLENTTNPITITTRTKSITIVLEDWACFLLRALLGLLTLMESCTSFISFYL